MVKLQIFGATLGKVKTVEIRNTQVKLPLCFAKYHAMTYRIRD